MRVRCVVACHNSVGEPDFFRCVVVCTEVQYDNGEHYEFASRFAETEGYEGDYVVFDENDGPFWLFERFYWENTPAIVVGVL